MLLIKVSEWCIREILLALSHTFANMSVKCMCVIYVVDLPAHYFLLVLSACLVFILPYNLAFSAYETSVPCGLSILMQSCKVQNPFKDQLPPAIVITYNTHLFMVNHCLTSQNCKFS